MKPPTILGSVVALMFGLGASGTAAAISSDRTPATSAIAPRGNVAAIVPGAAVGQSDGLGNVIHRGHTYPVEFLVWVAPNVRKATLALHADGAVLSSCTSKHLRTGATSAVMCLVRGKKATSHVSIDVVVRTSNLGTFSRTFTHTLTR